MGQGNWVPLIGALTAIFIVGTMLTFIMSTFISPETNTDSSIYQQGIAGFLQNGFNLNLGIIGNLFFLPFQILPDSWRTYIVQSFAVWNIIPPLISIPLLIIIGVAMIFGIIKLFLP